jgi:uncharacterized protein (DUF433 family)
MRIDWHKHIAVDFDIHHGEPCITGTRVPVSMIVGSVADGMTFDEILEAYPQLKKESIQAALAYAADIVRHDVFLPLAG